MKNMQAGYRVLGAWILGLSTLASTVSGGELTIRGSDSTIVLMKALAAEYASAAGKVVKVEGGGSGAGAKACAAGEADMAFLSRELNEGEKKNGLDGHAYALDGVAVIVNKGNPIEKVTLAELKDYFSGTTTEWPDGKPVNAFNRNADSGTRECFQTVVMKDAKFSEKAAVKHDAILLSSVAKIDTAIGYDSACVVHAEVKVLAVDGVAPSVKAIQDKTYPICRTLTLATKGVAAGDAKAFLDFVLGPKGQAVVSKSGYVPIK